MKRNTIARLRTVTAYSLLLFATILNSAYASSPRLNSVHHVTASHYGLGDGFHGKVTANCSTFNKNALTAAHKSLRLGTVVKLCNPKIRACKRVTITDRGPYIPGRDIDVASIGVGKPLKVEGDTALTMRIISVPSKPVMGTACRTHKTRPATAVRRTTRG